jgi:prolipoprotein diacylglyceryltransferase
LFEAFGEFGIFVLLLALRRRWRPVDLATGRSTDESGRLILTYAACYAVLRFIVEIFRGDSSRRYIIEWTSPRVAGALALAPDQPLFLSVSQFASLLVLIAVGATFAWRNRRHREDRPTNQSFTS